MEYRFIAPQELRQWWASVRTGLEKIKSRSPENWIVEDVYTDCFNQKSLLFVLIENNHYAGFFVIQPQGQTMHLWAAYSLENSYDVVENALKYIKGMAVEAKVKYITFSSHRRGWSRRAAQYGFRPKLWIMDL